MRRRVNSFAELWLVDSTNPNRYAIAATSAGGYGSFREFRTGGKNDGLYSGTATQFAFADNTWYRLVLAGVAGQNIRASLLADDGTTELVGKTLSLQASAFPSGFEFGLGQSMGAPGAPYPIGVAIDWVRLTTTAVPEPSALILGGIALGTLALARKWAFRRTSQAY